MNSCMLLLLLLMLAFIVIILYLLLKLKRRNKLLTQQIADLELTSSRLQAAERAAKQYAEDVSHEIHAALSVFHDFANCLLQRPLPSIEIERMAYEIKHRASHMSNFCKQLLLISRLDHHKQALKKQSVQLRKQLQLVLSDARYKLAGKQILAILKVKEHIFIYVDGTLMMQVWSNLIENAIRHTEIGGTITIEASTENEKCSIEITNTGKAIKEEMIPHLFERFYFNAQGDAFEGNGLGLSIVKMIVELHDGLIDIVSKEHIGTKAVICMPLSVHTH